MLKTVTILGVSITNETPEKVSEYVRSRIKNSQDKFFIATPNPEILVYANSHLDYKDKLNRAEVNLPDGIGLKLAGKLVGIPLKNRITGTDFIEKLCESCRDNPLSIGFLGGRNGVAEKTANRLKIWYPWINIAFVSEEWSETGFKEGYGPEKQPIDILFVAFGFPKQEEWIVEHLPTLPIRCAMGVGGAFDYISGKVFRAPKVIRFFGLEWLFRLVVQPWRLKRQTALLKFIWLVLTEKKTEQKPN